MQGPCTGATFQTPGMPGTTPYTEDRALADAFPATTAVHFHSIVALVVADSATDLLDAGHVIIVRVHVVVVRAQDAVRALCLRFDFGLKRVHFQLLSPVE